MAVRKINESTLTAIGNAIRAKTGGSALINPEDMADEIDSIQTGGGSNYGIWTASGEVEFADQNVSLITLPINCPCNNAIIDLKAVKSGTVTNGVVTEDSVLTAHISKSVMFGWHGRTYSKSTFPPVIEVAGTGYSSSYTKQLLAWPTLSILYATSSKGLNMTTLYNQSVEGATNGYQYLDNGSLILTSNNYSSTYVFCYTGIYMKYHYDVIAWNE